MNHPQYRDHDPVGNLLLYLNARMQLSTAFNPAILPMMLDQTLTQKLQVARPGEVLTTAYWLDDAYGCSYKMVPDKDGIPVKKISEIFPPKSVLLDADGFFNNVPGNDFIEIVRGSTVVPFSRESFAALRLEAPEAHALANCIMAELQKQSKTHIALLGLKGDQRYYELIHIYGIKILQCFSQKSLASYLNYTPQHLNRLISGDHRGWLKRKRVYKVLTFINF